jgi:hypothetical protein
VYYTYEKKENMRLVQSWQGTETYLIPKAPFRNSHHARANKSYELGNTKKNLEKRVRGWFPQETKLPKNFNALQRPAKKRNGVKIGVAGVIFVAIAILFSIVLFQSINQYFTTNTYNTVETNMITANQAPNVNTVNVTLVSQEGKIWVHFTDDPTIVSKVEFVEAYGCIWSDNGGFENRGPDWYIPREGWGQSPPKYNTTIQNAIVTINASTTSTFINITLNKHLNYNLNFWTLFGDQKIYMPDNFDGLKTANIYSAHGTVKYYSETNPQQTIAPPILC